MTSNATVQSFCHNCRFEDPFYKKKSFYRTLVQLLATLVKNSLTHSLTNSCLVDLTDLTLAFEDTKSKLLDVVSVADVDAKERNDNSLVKILKLHFDVALRKKS